MSKSSDNYYKHQFYIDMKNIDNKSLSVESYIQSNFNTFWKSFYDYLTVFHKPIPKKMFSNPKDYLMVCLKSVLKIISATTYTNYNPEMKQDMTNCFKTLLFPENIDAIKNLALESFMLLYPRTINSQKHNEYTEGFEQYFFDFSPFDSSLKFDLNEEMRIQNIDQTETRNERVELITKLSNFLNTIQNNCLKNNDLNTFLLWWPFILKYIIGVVFYSILSNKPIDKGITNLNSFVRSISSLMIELLTNVSTHERLEQLLKIDKTADCFIDIIDYFTIKSLDDKTVRAFINAFVITVIEKDQNGKTFVSTFNEINWELLKKMTGSMLNYLNFLFLLKNQGTQDIENISYNIKILFNLLYQEYNIEQQRSLCEYFANCTKDKDPQCILHIITLLLSFFVENHITDEKIWSTFVNREIYGISLQLTLKCYCNFAGYFSTCAMPKLIDLDRNAITNSIITAPLLNSYIQSPQKKYWINDEFTGLLMHENAARLYLSERPQLINETILESPEITNISLPGIYVEEWSKEDLISFLRAMFDSFNWQTLSDDEETQFLFYLIRASFIIPLLRITQAVTPDIPYDTKFLLEEFFPFLKSCTDNSNHHDKIKLNALNLLGNIVCNVKSLPYMNDNLLSDWYDILLKCIETNKYTNPLELRMGIKVSALTFSCRSIQIGFKGSSILLTTIANNFKLPEQLLSKAAANNKRSFVVDRGCEILTRKELASIILSLCNVCEITNLFDINPYDQQKIKEMRNELKEKLYMNLFKEIEPDLFSITLLSQLTDETENNEEFLIDFLMKKLLDLINNKKPANVYSIISIIFILPELEKTKAGSVQKLIDECLKSIDGKPKDENENEELFVRFVEFVVDLLIYSSFIIDTTSSINLFQSIVSKWDISINPVQKNQNDQLLIESAESNVSLKDDSPLRTFSQESKQRIEYAIMHLTSHYLRYPPPSRILSLSNDANNQKSASFGSSEDCILNVREQSVHSTLPVGKFKWTFKSVAPSPKQLRLSDDIKINEILPDSSEIEMQQKYSNKFSTFVENLHSNHFVDLDSEPNGDVFQVIHHNIWKPEDFLTNQDFKIPKDSQPIELKEDDFIPHRTIPYSVGPNAAAFMSSLNFFDSIQTTRLFPIENNSNEFQTVDYHHIVHIGFIQAAQLNSSHLKDFVAGLGYVDEKTNNVIYEDFRHQFVFHTNISNISNEPTIYICWNENLNSDDYNNSFKISLKLRIDITPTHMGLFNVSFLVPNQIQGIPLYENVLVSKKVLPVFILSQIMMNTHMIELTENKVVRPQLNNGLLIREYRKKQFIPADQMKPLNCEESLLLNASNQSFN